jgi:hypothetical protein
MSERLHPDGDSWEAVPVCDVLGKKLAGRPDKFFAWAIAAENQERRARRAEVDAAKWKERAEQMAAEVTALIHGGEPEIRRVWQNEIVRLRNELDDAWKIIAVRGKWNIRKGDGKSHRKRASHPLTMSAEEFCKALQNPGEVIFPYRQAPRGRRRRR